MIGRPLGVAATETRSLPAAAPNLTPIGDRQNGCQIDRSGVQSLLIVTMITKRGIRLMLSQRRAVISRDIAIG